MKARALVFVLLLLGPQVSVARLSRTHEDPEAWGGTMHEPWEPESRARNTMEFGWRNSGHATEARSATSQIRAQEAAKESVKDAQHTAASADKSSPLMAPVLASAKAVDKSVEEAKKIEAEVKKLVEDTYKLAYDAAKKAAEARVKKLEEEAAAYWKELLAKLAAMANKPKDPAAEAAAKAAEPYFKLQLRVADIVAHYNLQATTLVDTAKQMVALAFKLANQANIEQAQGESEMGLRHMIQAHMLVDEANVKEDLAKKVYKLAMSLNASIPAYMNAAQQAAVHVLATFSGLQLDSQTRQKRNPFAVKTKDKPDSNASEADMVVHVSENAMAQADQGLQAVGSALKDLSAQIASARAATAAIKKH